MLEVRNSTGYFLKYSTRTNTNSNLLMTLNIPGVIDFGVQMNKLS